MRTDRSVGLSLNCSENGGEVPVSGEMLVLNGVEVETKAPDLTRQEEMGGMVTFSAENIWNVVSLMQCGMVA